MCIAHAFAWVRVVHGAVTRLSAVRTVGSMCAVREPWAVFLCFCVLCFVFCVLWCVGVWCVGCGMRCVLCPMCCVCTLSCCMVRPAPRPDSYTPYLAMGDALAFRSWLGGAGGDAAIMTYIHSLAGQAGAAMAAVFHTDVLSADPTLYGSMVGGRTRPRTPAHGPPCSGITPAALAPWSLFPRSHALARPRGLRTTRPAHVPRAAPPPGPACVDAPDQARGRTSTRRPSHPPTLQCSRCGRRGLWLLCLPAV